MVSEGYLQNKIRELQEKIKSVEIKIEKSLEREKNLTKAIKDASSQERQITLSFMRDLINSKIDKMYKEKFEKIFNSHYEKMSKDIVLNAKGFNYSIDSLLKEISLLKKDNDFLNNFIIYKLKVSPEEWEDFCRKFDANYPKDKVEDYYKRFRMKIYKNKELVKKGIIDAKQEVSE